jgi:hypothetical protein
METGISCPTRTLQGHRASQRLKIIEKRGVVEYDQHDWSCTLNSYLCILHEYVRYSPVAVSLEDRC